MTNAEWLNEMVPDISQGIKTAIMESRGVVPGDPYSGGQSIELAEADLYMRMLILPEFKEGSLSIKYNLSSLKEAANSIYKKYGDPRFDSGEPMIRRIRL